MAGTSVEIPHHFLNPFFTGSDEHIHAAAVREFDRPKGHDFERPPNEPLTACANSVGRYDRRLTACGNGLAWRLAVWTLRDDLGR